MSKPISDKPVQDKPRQARPGVTRQELQRSQAEHRQEDEPSHDKPTQAKQVKQRQDAKPNNDKASQIGKARAGQDQTSSACFDRLSQAPVSQANTLILKLESKTTKNRFLAKSDDPGLSCRLVRLVQFALEGLSPHQVASRQA